MPDTAMTKEEEATFSENCETMRKLYRAMGIAQANLIARVMDHDNVADIVAHAQAEVDRICAEELGTYQCGPGTIWDEKLRTCVPI